MNERWNLMVDTLNGRIKGLGGADADETYATCLYVENILLPNNIVVKKFKHEASKPSSEGLANSQV